MTESENPAGQGGVPKESAEGAVSAVHDSSGSITEASVLRAEIARERAEAGRSAGPRAYADSVGSIAGALCDAYLAPERIDALRMMDPRRVGDELLGKINAEIAKQNARVKDGKLTGTKLLPLTRLRHAETARIVAALYSVISVKPSKGNTNPALDLLAAYDDDPTSPHYGIYRSDSGHLRQITRRYCPDLTTKEFAEVIAALADLVPRKTRGQNRDLVACNNCIVDYNSGNPQRIEFSPEHVFLSKLAVDWNPDAAWVSLDNPSHCQHVDPTECDLRCTCCESHTDAADCGPACQEWDVESWMSTLSDDPEVVHLLWQMLGAVCRPYVSWNQFAMLLSEVGNNGKGTYLSLARGLVGLSGYASIPLADFGKRFALEPLKRANAILVDENDVGGFVDRAADLKAVVTNDVVSIEAKFENPVAHQHFGFMIQCVNERPSFKDKSDALYRRQLVIPFTKCFTGRERKYIKDDFLQRREVLEYVLKRVLTMTYYDLIEPAAVKAAVEAAKVSDNPTRMFWEDVRYQLRIDLVPNQFLYDLYTSWMARNQPNSRPVGRNRFLEQLAAVVEPDPHWAWPQGGRGATVRVGARLSAREPLLAEYDLSKWMDPKAAAASATVAQRETVRPTTFAAGLLWQGPVGLPDKQTWVASQRPGLTDEQAALLDFSQQIAEQGTGTIEELVHGTRLWTIWRTEQRFDADEALVVEELMAADPDPHLTAAQARADGFTALQLSQGRDRAFTATWRADGQIGFTQGGPDKSLWDPEAQTYNGCAPLPEDEAKALLSEPRGDRWGEDPPRGATPSAAPAGHLAAQRFADLPALSLPPGIPGVS